MSQPDETIEKRLLRSIKRRNGLKGLAIVIPALTLWWLLSHWLMRRYGIESNIASFGTLLCIGVLLRWLGLDKARDPRMTSRLHWLLKERSDRITSRTRRFWIVCMGLAIMLWVPIMLFDQRHSSNLADGWTVLLILMGSGRPNLLWRLPKTMDELERAHYLAATQRAYALTVSMCVVALVLDRYWPGRLPGMISLSLLAGILAQQVGLEMHEARAMTGDE